MFGERCTRSQITQVGRSSFSLTAFRISFVASGISFFGKRSSVSGICSWIAEVPVLAEKRVSSFRS